ncbi:MAG: hypothetical protein JNK45_02685 [Myxococcales bacterium]|nr:hypothetical protein [Myxococcales bacterium]
MRVVAHRIAWALLVGACQGPDLSSAGESSDSTTGSSGGSSSAAAPPADLGAEMDDTAATSSTTGGDDPFGDDPPDGEPLPPAPPGVWQWVDIDRAICRDGSQARIAVRYGTTNELLVYFAPGGACFNGGTCLLSPPNLDDAPLYQGGIFADRPDNPVRDWNVVLVPYCTGDIHVGARDDGVSFANGADRFVGWIDNGLYLSRIHPTFADVDRLLVAGSSAGGFGGGSNFERYVRRFAPPAAIMIDDSGPPMSDDYLPPCLQAHWREIWGISDTFLASCGDACSGQRDGGGIIHVVEHLSTALPNTTMGFISHLEDETMRLFYGYGLDECSSLYSLAPLAYPAEQYAEGLFDLRDFYATSPQWGTYYLDGSSHTTLLGDGFYTADVGGVSPREWFVAMLDGEPSHVAP